MNATPTAQLPFDLRDYDPLDVEQAKAIDRAYGLPPDHLSWSRVIPVSYMLRSSIEQESAVLSRMSRSDSPWDGITSLPTEEDIARDRARLMSLAERRCYPRDVLGLGWHLDSSHRTRDQTTSGAMHGLSQPSVCAAAIKAQERLTHAVHLPDLEPVDLYRDAVTAGAAPVDAAVLAVWYWHPCQLGIAHRWVTGGAGTQGWVRHRLSLALARMPEDHPVHRVRTWPKTTREADYAAATRGGQARLDQLDAFVTGHPIRR